MKIKYLLVSVLSLTVIALAGCGSSGSESTPPAQQPSLSTTINGVASLGPINGGTVKVFAIKNGAVDTSTVLASGTTDANGNFSVAGNFTGAVEVAVTGGSFTDEATDQVVNLNVTTELTAMVSNATGTKAVAVTALTQLASEKATADGMTLVAIDAANAKMSAMFQMSNIISALPDPNGTADQKKHAAANTVISHVVNNRKHSGESTSDALQRVMGDLGTEVSKNGGFSDSTLAEIESEVESEHSAITSISHPSGTLKISTAGGTGIGALDMTITLPQGVTVAADSHRGRNGERQAVGRGSGRRHGPGCSHGQRFN